jgi:peroxiredoxin
MRKILFILLLAGALLSGAETPKRAPVIPRKAAEFDFRMLDSSQRLLSSYKGKAVVIAFFFTTCQHCQQTAQVLMKMQSEYAPKGLQVLSVVFEEGAAGRLQQFIKATGLTFPLAYSDQGKVLEFLQYPPTAPYTVPVLAFIDKGGTIRGEYAGDDKFLTGNEETNIRAEIERVLKAGSSEGTQGTAAGRKP